MRRLVALVLGTILLLSSAAAVSADTAVIVMPARCGFFFGGVMTVDPGSTVYLNDGWSAKTRGEIVSFMQASTWVLTVNGTRIDVRPYLSGPTKVDTFWEVTWLVPTGITLDLGDSMTVTDDLVLNHPNFDGYNLYPIGSVYGGPQACVVTGAVGE
jgi:hypothetical protein